MKKIIALVLAMVMITALAVSGTAFADNAKVGKTVLSVAFNQTITNPEAQALLKLSDDLYDATEGRYSLEVYPDASLGDQAQTMEQCIEGALEMTLVGNAIVESYVSDFAIIGTPYVYDSEDHCEKVFESGVLADLLAETEEKGFTVLSLYSLGARNLYTRDKAVSTPADLAGMNIRVMGSQTCIDMMNAMGGVGISMPQGDVYTAIQTKTLDGAENNIITFTDLVQYEVAPYYNYSYHLMVPDSLCINNEVLEDMGADGEILKQLAAESMPYAYELIQALHSEYEAKAVELGAQINRDVDVAAFQALCADLIQSVAGRNDVTSSVYAAIRELAE